MWRKRCELARLKALRQAAYDALKGTLITADRVAMVLSVYADASAGDLDNFITGVCDGLMAAHANTRCADADWSDARPEIHPRNPVAFRDDACVHSIRAERLPPVGGPHYDVELSW